MLEYKNDIEKDTTLDLQMKPAEVLIIEEDIQIINRKNN